MREYRRDESGDPFPYERPHLSAWIAAVAVAFSFFLLGGFIKTYRQLDALREESRKEIQELRDMIKKLQPQAGAAASRQSTPWMTHLPQPSMSQPSMPQPAGAPRQTPRIEESAAAVERRPEALRPPETPRLPAADSEAGDTKLTYEWGWKSKSASPDAASGGLKAGVRPGGAGSLSQVISVASAQKKLMVEGGRNIGLEDGGRLELARGGRWIGDLRVLEVYDNMASCEVLHSILPPQPGDSVRIP